MLTKPSINMLPPLSSLFSSDIIYARDYVKCDGTDEKTQLQAAFDAAKNKRLILPAGTIRFTGPIVLDPAANYIVEGQGRDPNGINSTVLRNIGTSGEIGIVCNDGLNLGRDNNRVFKDFALFGNQLSGDGMQFAAAFGFYLENLFISTHGGHGVYAYQCFSSTMKNCIVTHVGRHGVFFEEIANAVLLEKVVATDASKNGGGFANIRFLGSTNGNANLGVHIVSCDWTHPGILWGGGTDPNAVGLHLTRVWGATIHGNYAEIAPLYLTYIDSTCCAISFKGNYQQDGVCFIENGATGIVAENNLFQFISAFTNLNAASSQSANANRYFGNIMKNGATQNLAP